MRAVIWIPVIAVVCFAACGGSDKPEPDRTATREARNDARTATAAERTLASGTEIAVRAATINAEASQTAAARPTNTPSPTPSPTAEPTPYADRLLGLLSDMELIGGLGVDAVNTARLTPEGNFELEYRTSYASERNQPDVSWLIVQVLSNATPNWTADTTRVLFGTETWQVHLTTYSLTGNYRYQSVSTLDVLQKVAAKQMTYSEWVTAANAGFR